jgi:phosphoribosyl 1,2-cyclic phosphate phosphodiesterase
MEIVILGTGTSQGVPVIACECRTCRSPDPHDKRLRTSAWIRQGGTSIVIDAGPDFRQQMIRHGVRSLDAVLITHAHKDHTGGLDDVRAFNWVQRRPMDIYARESDRQAIMREFPYAFGKNKYPGAPDIRLREIDRSPFRIGEMLLTPIEAMHRDMPVVGFRMGDFSYLTDANALEAEQLEKMKGSRVVVINALRQEKHHSHFSLSEAVDILQLLRPEWGFLTHISHQMGPSREVGGTLPPGVFLAYDGLKINLNPSQVEVV